MDDGRLVVRRLVADEWELLRATRLAALADAPLAFGSTLTREQEFTEEAWRSRTVTSTPFVAELDGAVVGMASAWHQDDSPATEQHVVAMWVHPDHRGQGVATALVQTIADWAVRETGATELSLGVADGNEAALRLYERLGFVLTGDVQPLPNDPSRGERRMARPLP